ncbi:uncharacterized protein B0I36DRAFT_377323 [Microdochium trichocladiopsis]|uniref:Fumarylacetoacetase n=1 Tax=Microdochium trichocladiopsis TaxID=1682393 RepID=A0A9P9BLA1_9PEZI|nr:uncharacterized protein B0I36DRAFT_377323 [Microdochium trichocladiopsis]KAH7021492.1 hypothetical protein B0I36DRAFT_377323 [Microdochium trichocladiopsis]
MDSWLPISAKSHFSLANIPFGIISTSAASQPRVAVAIGDYALDLDCLARHQGFSQCTALEQAHLDIFSDASLNRFASLGRALHRDVRQYIQSLLRVDTPFPALLRDNSELRNKALILSQQITNHLPMTIGDYTDFFAGRNHAQTVGALFRGPDNALNPNYNHLPVAYHGRASSVVVSGTPLHRPKGQVMPPGAPAPVFKPCSRLDIELELGMFIARPNELGQPIAVDDADDYIFGYVLMNDWSARDIQAWEYVPLGPFNAKNFGTTISPWVVLADATEPFKTTGLPNDTNLQQYLKESNKENIVDFNLEVALCTEDGDSTVITRTSSKNLLWSWPQMIAHHTISGCNLRTGDLLGSGTISGLEERTQGSLLEQTRGGKSPIKLHGGHERIFVNDNDTIVMTGYAGTTKSGLVGFGECRGKILPCV